MLLFPRYLKKIKFENWLTMEMHRQDQLLLIDVFFHFVCRLNVFLNKGLLEPFGFHLFNLILHGTICSLTFPLFLTIFKGKHCKQIAFIASLLFAVHPIHSEAVIIFFFYIYFWIKKEFILSYSRLFDN